MELKSLNIVLFCSFVIVSGAQRQSYMLPERRSEVLTVNTGSSNAIPYEYQIVPSSEYAVSSYAPDESSILDYVLSPVTAIISVGSTALSAIQWLAVKGGLVLLGMGIIIGFCGLTTYCTMTIENPFNFGRGLPSIPYLDDIQYFFNRAYNKYHEMQSW